MPTEKLTVIIPCKNEQKNIRACIESVQTIADEILIADSGSQDRTLDIAREYNCRIIEREYINSADFKNWAIPQASHPWILLVDADERVTPELAGEVLETIANPNPCSAYYIGRHNFFFGYEINYSGWGTDKVIRLFNRDMSRYKTMRVHSEIIVSKGRTGYLKSRLKHYPYWYFGQVTAKNERYTTWAAEDMYDKGVKANLGHLALYPLWRFIRQYFIQRGFLDGIPGFMVCILGAFSVFSKYSKLWHMQRAKKQPVPEQDLNDNPGNSSF